MGIILGFFESIPSIPLESIKVIWPMGVFMLGLVVSLGYRFMLNNKAGRESASRLTSVSLRSKPRSIFTPLQYITRTTANTTRTTTPNKYRKPGHWMPEDFQFPIPQPYKDWSLKTTTPLPYRAFKHKYNITMGIRSMAPEDWIELDNEWSKFHDLKKKRIQEKGKELYGTSPEANDAALEALEEFRAYLPARYPSLFTKSTNGIEIKATGEHFVTIPRPEHDPMYIIAMLIQDDFAIMMEGNDGQYYFKAGAILLAGFWRFKDKINKSLAEIHTSGKVPKFTTHLQKGMEKFFTRLTPEVPVVRNNYFLQMDSNLDWSSSIGDEHNTHVSWDTAQPAKSIEQLYYRSERQSLRRLPKTGGIMFTIRTYFLPVTEVVREPFVPLRLLNGIESWSDDVKLYKGFDKFGEVLMPFLKEKVEEQRQKGYIRDVEVLKYPF